MAALPRELLARVLAKRPVTVQPLARGLWILALLRLPRENLLRLCALVFYAALAEMCQGCPDRGLLAEAAAFCHTVAEGERRLPALRAAQCPALTAQLACLTSSPAVLLALLAELFADDFSPSRTAVFGDTRLQNDTVALTHPAGNLTYDALGVHLSFASPADTVAKLDVALRASRTSLR